MISSRTTQQLIDRMKELGKAKYTVALADEIADIYTELLRRAIAGDAEARTATDWGRE